MASPATGTSGRSASSGNECRIEEIEGAQFYMYKGVSVAIFSSTQNALEEIQKIVVSSRAFLSEEKTSSSITLRKMRSQVTSCQNQLKKNLPGMITATKAYKAFLGQLQDHPGYLEMKKDLKKAIELQNQLSSVASELSDQYNSSKG